MLLIKPNHFYKCKDYHLLVYPSREKAATHHGRAAGMAEYLSEELNCKVGYTEKGSAFLVLENENKNNEYIKVLAKDKLGWINYREWTNCEEVI